MPKSTKTNASVWTRVFRRIVQQIETDPDMRRIFGPDNVRSWKGVPADKAPFEPTASKPVARLTPNPSNVDWFDPATQAGTLSVLVELAVSSLCIDDVADLWETIVQAVRPGATDGAGNSFALDLVALGAETGEIVFSDPAIDPRPEAEPEGRFFATGRFRLGVLRPLNP
jgi:hypothetical protein